MPDPKKYIVDASGKKIAVLLDIEEYERLLERLEELDALAAYRAAKASGETPIPFRSRTPATAKREAK